jgi:hypothetical protein
MEVIDKTLVGKMLIMAWPNQHTTIVRRQCGSYSLRNLALTLALIVCAWNCASGKGGDLPHDSQASSSRSQFYQPGVAELSRAIYRSCNAAPKTTEKWSALSVQSVTAERAATQELAKMRDLFVAAITRALGY